MNTRPPLRIAIPGRAELTLTDLVLDFNGTLAADGSMLAGVPQRLARLADILRIHVVTGDTYGSAAVALAVEPVHLIVLEAHEQALAKRDYVQRLGPAGTVAIGNGRNDCEMLRAAALGIAVFGAEGTCAALLAAADVLVPDALTALDLLLQPRRLVATLRS
ncbi:MAG: HAD hydrolase family protein [Gammaproteobacteria bacterium]